MIQYKHKGHHNLRHGRFSQAHGIYSITTTSWQRHRVFAQWPYAHAAVQAFTHKDIIKDAQLLCWVLMPDHVHWLVQLGSQRELSVLIGTMKSASARAVRHAGYQKKVWSKGFYDRAIRKEDDIASIARYIAANPLRAGLVNRIGNYPFWDAVYLP